MERKRAGQNRDFQGGTSLPVRVLSGLLNFLRRDSLLRTVTVGLILAALVPVFLYGAISYYRSRQQIGSLVATQLASITSGGEKQIQDYIVTRGSALEQIMSDTQFSTLLNAIILPESVSKAEAANAALLLRNYLVLQSAGPGEALFDQIIVLDKTGGLLASSDSQWVNTTFGTVDPGIDPRIRDIFAKGNSSTLMYDPFLPYDQRFTIATVRLLKIPGVPDPVTTIGFSSSRLFTVLLDQLVAIFPDAKAYYYFQPEKALMGKGTEPRMAILDAPPAVLSAVLPIVEGAKTRQPLTFVSFDNRQVLAYVRQVSTTGLSIILEVPTQSVFGTLPLLDTFNIYMLAISLAVLLVLGYFASTRVVNPLEQLNQVARSFASRKFDQRANIRRSDEVGQLADSMNRMAEELETLYSTLEDQVEQRTAQLRTAAEVAQLATTSTRMEETLEKTVEMVSERFGYYHTAIYLVDETGAGILLKQASGELGQMRVRRARRIPMTESSLPCWVARNHTARVLDDTSAEDGFQLEDMLPDTRSEVSIPIAVGSEVLGVLDVHSVQPKAFDADAVYVLQTLANQIAATLQNTRLLSSTQVNLEETSLLYRLTRQITAAKDEQAITDLLIDILPQLPNTNALLSQEEGNLHILGLYDSRTRKFEQNLYSIDIPYQRIHDTLVTGQPVYIQDITQPTNYDNILSFFLRRGSKSAVILPSLKDGEVARLIVIGYREDQQVNQAMLQPYVNLAEVITTTFEKFSVMDALQQRLQELQILANFSNATSSETDLDHLYRVLHDQVKATIGSDIGFLIAIYNDKMRQIEIPYASEGDELISLEPLPLGQGLTSYVIESRKPLLLTRDTERRAQELGARIVGRPARSWMGIPLLVGGDMVGAMVMQDQLHEERFSEIDMNLFVTIAPQIAVAVRNAQLVDEMQAALRAYDEERLLINTWLENTPDVIIIKNAHGHYVRSSRSVEHYFGVKPENIIGKSDFDLMSQEAASRATEEELLILQEGTPRLGLIEMNDRGEEETWFLASKIPILNPVGDPFGLLTIRRDITPMKLSEIESKRRADELLIAAEIAREASSTLNIDDLLSKAVNLVRDRFGFYHASIFLIDPLGQDAVLRESTGEAGRLMKANAHRLAIGSKSVVGQATARGEVVIINDVTNDPTHFPNPLLPNTRAETALPLKIGSRILGAIDVQSTQPGSFNPESISVLSILADQLAVAVDNAGLFAATQDMLGKHRLLHQITVAASTSNGLTEALERVVNGLVIAQVANRAGILLASRGELETVAITGYDIASLSSTRIPFGKGIIGSAAQERRSILVQDTRNDPRYYGVDDSTRSELALPIIFGDEVMGVLNMESDAVAAFDTNDQEIMSALVNNIGAIIANWRLVSQIRRQVERQQFLFDAVAKIRRSADIDTILQTSVKEIGRAMGAKRARITLAPAAQTQSSLEQEPPAVKTIPAAGNNGKNGAYPAGLNGKEVKE
jgi:PAS domain S-box-containing protein